MIFTGDPVLVELRAEIEQLSSCVVAGIRQLHTLRSELRKAAAFLDRLAERMERIEPHLQAHPALFSLKQDATECRAMAARLRGKT